MPIIIVIIGEGASGGALGIGLGDRILMLENAWYTVISPEGCAAILFRDRAEAPRAADALKLTAVHLLAQGMIDEIINEPDGAAHNNHKEAAFLVGNSIERNLEELLTIDKKVLLENRFKKYRSMGIYQTTAINTGV